MEDKVFMEDDRDYAIAVPIKKRNYQTVIKNFDVKKFDAVEQEKKPDDYDFVCELNDGIIIKIEFKNRKIGNRYDDIALEVYHHHENKYGGCVFNLIDNEVDYYIYTWHEKPKRGYIILHAKKLCSWWKKNFTSYDQRINKSTYNRNDDTFRNQSSWCPVPIKDIPNEIIYKYEIFSDLEDFGGTR